MKWLPDYIDPNRKINYECKVYNIHTNIKLSTAVGASHTYEQYVKLKADVN